MTIICLDLYTYVFFGAYNWSKCYLSEIGQNIKVSFEHKCLILLAEPQAHIETWEDEEDAYLARAVYEHMQLNDEQV